MAACDFCDMYNSGTTCKVNLIPVEPISWQTFVWGILAWGADIPSQVMLLFPQITSSVDAVIVPAQYIYHGTSLGNPHTVALQERSPWDATSTIYMMKAF